MQKKGDLAKKIGSRVKELRKGAGLNQKRLAEGMNDPFMEQAIVTPIGKYEEVLPRTHDG